MRKYHQLTEEDRIEIYAMKQAGKEQKKIAGDNSNPRQNGRKELRGMLYGTNSQMYFSNFSLHLVYQFFWIE